MLTKYDSMLSSPFNIWDPFQIGLSDLRYHQTSSFETELSDDGVTLTVELPGVKLGDIKITTTDKEVTISGQRRGKEFKHTYLLSKTYDTSTADATLADGILTIKFLKSQSARPKQVTIRTG